MLNTVNSIPGQIVFQEMPSKQTEELATITAKSEDLPNTLLTLLV